MRYSILLIFFVVGYSTVTSQVTFTEQPQVRSLMEHNISVGQGEEMIEGWRIKVISTTNRRAVETAAARLTRDYPEYSFQRDYEAPYYSLKVGAYETRFDVEPVLGMFKKDFSSAIPFRDRITKQELFSQDGE